MEQYFPFHKLEQYRDMLDSVFIFALVILIIYVLTSLYYWTTRDLLKK